MQNYNSKSEVFAFLILFSVFYFLFSGAVFAAEGYKLEVPLPPLPGTSDPGAGIAQYIQYLYVFAIALAGFLALGAMVYGGLQYVLAAGNVAKVEDAKDIITQALWGLGLILVAYLLLRTINPDLVSLKTPSLEPPTIKGAFPVAGVDDPCSKPLGPGSTLVCDPATGKWSAPGGGLAP